MLWLLQEVSSFSSSDLHYNSVIALATDERVLYNPLHMSIEIGLDRFSSSRMSVLEYPENDIQGTIGLFSLAEYALPVDRQSRSELAYAIRGVQGEEVSLSRAVQIVSEAYHNHEKKFSKVGLTPSLHVLFLHALVHGNTPRLDRIVRISEQFLKSSQTLTHADERATHVYDVRLMQKHDRLILPKLKKYARTPSKELHVLVGIPGSGKTELAAAVPQLSQDRVLHSDVDIARRTINPLFDHTDQQQIARDRYEAWRYTDRESILAMERNISVCIHTPLARDSWMDPNQAVMMRAHEAGYSVTLHVIMRPVFDSYRRAQFRERMVTPKDFLFALRGYEHVIPFARMHGAAVRLYDYRSYLQQRVKLPDPIGDTYFSSLLHAVDNTTVHLVPQSGDIAILKSH